MFGATEESIEAVHGPKESDFHVWPENWPAWLAFLAVQTQWESAGMGGLSALNYTRVRDGLHMAGIECTPEIFYKLRVIENAVLKLLRNKDSDTSAE